MKKILIKGICFIIIGFLIGEIIFGNKKKYFDKLKNSETYYFLQEGVYQNKDTLENNLKIINEKIIEQEKDKYYVYIGITKDKEVLEKLIKIYKKNGLNIYPKEKNIISEEFSTNVTQFDLLIKESKEESQILTIEKVILSNYEEIIQKR